MKASIIAVTRRDTRWERDMTALSAGQTATCTGAIRQYMRRSRATQRAKLRLLRTHPHATVAALLDIFERDPYRALLVRQNETAARAASICG